MDNILPQNDEGSESTDTSHQNTRTPNHQPTETLFPTETEIYILPDGRVIVADLPTELSALVERVGVSLEGPAVPIDSRNNPEQDYPALPQP